MLPSLMRFSRSGLSQYFTLSEERGAAHDERDLRAVPPIAVERRLRGRVAGSDDRPPLTDIRAGE